MIAGCVDQIRGRILIKFLNSAKRRVLTQFLNRLDKLDAIFDVLRSVQRSAQNSEGEIFRNKQFRDGASERDSFEAERGDLKRLLIVQTAETLAEHRQLVADQIDLQE